MLQAPKILSVITVCYNDAKNLLITLENVRQQTYPHIECIVVDGGSTDETMQVIMASSERIQHWVSQPDNGLYDAMNRGMKMASGDYLIYLNAGDRFYNEQVVAHAMSQSSGHDVLYGDAIVVNQDGSYKSLRHKKVPSKLDWMSFTQGMVVSHQALIISTSIVEPYDLKYKITADIDWAIRCLQKSKSTYHLGVTICKFQTGGISSQRRASALPERWKILNHHFGLIRTTWAHLIILGKKIMRVR